MTAASASLQSFRYVSMLRFSLAAAALPVVQFIAGLALCAAELGSRNPSSTRSHGTGTCRDPEAGDMGGLP